MEISFSSSYCRDDGLARWFSKHFLELLFTRIMILAPIFIIGFSQQVVGVYIIIIGFLSSG